MRFQIDKYQNMASFSVECFSGSLSVDCLNTNEQEAFAQELIGAACELIGVSHDKYDALARFVNDWADEDSAEKGETPLTSPE